MRRFLLSVYIAALGMWTLTWAATSNAQLGARSADEWVKTLEGVQRVSTLKIDEVVARLQLKPGDVVADIGAGSGLFEVPLAKAVAKDGKVYAVDIEAGLFPEIMKKAQAGHVDNVQTVLGKYSDPLLPVKNIDLVLFNDVLHHIEDRAGYLKTVSRYLKPNGRVVVIDFQEGQGPHQDHPELQVARQQLAEWAAGAGLQQIEDIQMFPDKYFLIYSK